MKKDTDLLILELAREAGSVGEARNWPSNYWFSWIGCLSLMALLTYLAAALLPAYIHLPTNLKSVGFWLDAGMWFVLAALGARIAYLSSMPGFSKPALERAAVILFGILMASLVFRSTPSAYAEGLQEELHWLRGPCGFFILVTGALSASWMFFVIRRAAPLELQKTTAWAAVSTGALGSMFMHLVCTHEDPVHVFLWHVVPLFLLIGVFASFGKKVLHW